MSKMNITSPQGQKDFVEQQSALLREKLLQGANSPLSSTADKAFFDKLRNRINSQR